MELIIFIYRKKKMILDKCCSMDVWTLNAATPLSAFCVVSISMSKLTASCSFSFLFYFCFLLYYSAELSPNQLHPVPEKHNFCIYHDLTPTRTYTSPCNETMQLQKCSVWCFYGFCINNISIIPFGCIVRYFFHLCLRLLFQCVESIHQLAWIHQFRLKCEKILLLAMLYIKNLIMLLIMQLYCEVKVL